MTNSRVGWSLSFVVAVLFVSLSASSSARAFPPASSGAKTVPTAGGTSSTSPFEAQIEALRATRTILENADHDYKGHRAAAVKLVNTAIHALHPHHTAAASNAANKGTKAAPSVTKNGASTPKASRPAMVEAQAASDAQLKQAAGQLAVIQAQLAGASGAGAATAVAALQKAVQELQIAVSIK
jgi:hypothetical protein